MSLVNKSKPIIFLIEDDLDDQYMFKMVLKTLNLEADVVTFEDGLSAYQTLSTVCTMDNELSQRNLPDLILLDLNLPIWDGKKTLAVLKKDQRLKSIPVIIYTTSKSEYDIADCYELGANSFISKAAGYGMLQNQIKNMFTYWFTTVLL